MEIPPKLILLQKRLSFFLYVCVTVSDKTIVEVFMAVWKNLIVSKAQHSESLCKISEQHMAPNKKDRLHDFRKD